MSAHPTAALPRRSLRAGFALLARDAKRRWYVFALVALVWALAWVRLFASPTPLLPILFNWTDSLPYTVAIVDYESRQVNRGDLIMYSFAGEAADSAYPGLRNQPFFKRVVGLPGDKVTTRDRDVFVNGTFVGRAKTHTKDKRLPLEPIAAITIPPGYFYVQGTSVDSFDSRYRSSGLVALQDVVSKLRPIF